MSFVKAIELPCFGIRVWTHDGCGHIESRLCNEDDPPELIAAFNTIESMILAHACADVEIDSPEYIEGIETAVNAVINNLT